MISAAIVGCGRMGAFTSESVRTWSPDYWLPLSHADAFKLHPDIDLRGFSDIDGDAVVESEASIDIQPNLLVARLESISVPAAGIVIHVNVCVIPDGLEW